jgi:hypothetical protein
VLSSSNVGAAAILWYRNIAGLIQLTDSRERQLAVTGAPPTTPLSDRVFGHAYRSVGTWVQCHIMPKLSTTDNSCTCCWPRDGTRQPLGQIDCIIGIFVPHDRLLGYGPFRLRCFCRSGPTITPATALQFHWQSQPSALIGYHGKRRLTADESSDLKPWGKGRRRTGAGGDNGRKWRRIKPNDASNDAGTPARFRALRREFDPKDELHHAASATIAAISRFTRCTVPLPHPTIFATLRMPLPAPS